MARVRDPAWWKWQAARVTLSATIVCIVVAIVSFATPSIPQFDLPDSRQLAEKFVYVNHNDTYSPSAYVKYGHKITGQEFEANMDYVKRVLYAPALLFILGIVSFVILLFGLMFRCCCNCAKCLPDLKDISFERNRFYHSLVYYLLVLLVLVFDQLVFLGNSSIDSGVKTIDDSLLGVRDVFQAIDDGSVTMLALGVDLDDEYSAAKTSCPASTALDVSKDVDSYNDAILAFQKAARAVVKAINAVHDRNQQYGIFYRNIFLYVVWGLAIVSALLFVIGHATQSVCFTQFSMVFGTTTYLLFLLLGIVWLVVTSILADLCMDPSYNAVTSLPSGNDLQKLANFYVTCVGNNTLQEHMNDGYTELRKANESVGLLLGTSCPNNADLQHMQATLADIGTAFRNTSSSLDCPPLQTLWFEFVNQGVCDETYQGLFYIWGSQLITSFFLFFLIVTASVMYQYYSSIRVVPGDEEAVEVDDRMPSAHSPRGGQSPRGAQSPRGTHSPRQVQVTAVAELKPDGAVHHL